MVQVCQIDFPKGSFPYQKKDGFYMEALLKQQLDYYIKNVGKDWDFVIIISGEGEVRVGKSVLAQQIGMYWTSEVRRIYGANIPFSVKDNLVFDGARLIERGNTLGKNYKMSCLIFDEAGADLEGTKVMRQTTQAVKDFMRECGQYNMLTILVLPDYFDLPKGIALSRSNCLLNVYWNADEEGNFKRGYFKFFSKPSKKWLYLNGKRNLDYSASSYDFAGVFSGVYPLPEEEYRHMKYIALKKRESSTVDKKMMQRNIAWMLLHERFGLKISEISTITSNMGFYTPHNTISDAIKGAKMVSGV